MADPKTTAVDESISEAEARPMSAEEKKFFDAALQSLDKDQQARA
jgi:hypothetical protein